MALLINGLSLGMALLPKMLGHLKRIDLPFPPPGHLVARLMELTMVTTAERHGEHVTDFETEGSGLGKAQVMRIRRLSTTDQARL
ncbi:MAG: hypothetical protein WCE27_04780 [Pseudolabrys sp.]